MINQHPNTVVWQRWLTAIGYKRVEHEALDNALQGKPFSYFPNPDDPGDAFKGSYVTDNGEFASIASVGRIIVRRSGSPEGAADLVLDSADELHAFQRFLLTPLAKAA